MKSLFKALLRLYEGMYLGVELCVLLRPGVRRFSSVLHVLSSIPVSFARYSWSAPACNDAEEEDSAALFGE